MDLTYTQRQTIQSLVSLSASARALAARVDPSLVDKADIATLQGTIVAMEGQIADLKEQLESAEHPQGVFTDEDAHGFTEALTSVLSPMSYRTIVTCYDRTYLIPYPKNIRVLICTVLLNVFQKRNMTPSDLWTSVLASNGSLN